MPLAKAVELSTRLGHLGWHDDDNSKVDAYVGDGTSLGRVSAEHKGGYVLLTAEGEVRGSLVGKLRRAIELGQEERPTVGDWVVWGPSGASGLGIMHGVLPRRTCVARRVVGRASGKQVVAANVDVVMIATAIGADLNARRLERYLAVVRESGALPVVVITKADKMDAPLDEVLEPLRDVVAGVRVHVTSAVDGVGLDALDAYFHGHRTVAIVGSSGVGKSTLVNRWLGVSTQVTASVRDDDKGRHTTTHRALFVLPTGGLVLDTPGMREVGLWDAEAGLDESFDELEMIARECRFRDCTHQNEPGCALREAVADGKVDALRFESFQRLVRELRSKEGLKPSSTVGRIPRHSSRRTAKKS